MKNILFVAAIITMLSFRATAQPGKKPNAQNPAVQAKLNEEMEKAMKNMTPAQKEQMKKMMGNIMPAMLENANDYRYPEITNNRELLYKKDIARINAIPKKKLTQADIPAYANNLFSKIMAKGDAAEIAIIKNVMAKGKDADHFGNAAILCMLQGHSQAAMGLSIKAVQTDPANANWQNNMASLLTQYGYAEQAIPVLQKLRNEFDDNSTVLNNLAQSWFSLGAVDSAKYFASAAIKSNPLNPDAMVCGGVIDEAEGNTESATEKYIQAMAQSPDGFTESVLKNSAGQNAINNIDFEKLKNSITIYAYFPKDWVKIPELSDNVSGFENDKATQNGYAKMFQSFHKELKAQRDMAEKEINASLKKGKEEFAKDMMTAGMKQGNSFITTPARIIKSLILIKLARLSQEYAQEKQKLDNLIKEKTQEKITAARSGQCDIHDQLNNQFMAEVNPIIRNFFSKYIEEYRIWLNALCTWTWYNTGNIKNFSMVECLSFTQFYADLFRDAIASQQTAFQCGKEGIRSNGEIKPNTPLIPPFKCPTVVSVPVGQDWHALDNALKNLNANSLGITKIAGAPVPNISITMGIGGSHIAQPGHMPFTKTANGSMLPQYASNKSISNDEVNAAIDRGLGKLLRETVEKNNSQVKTGDNAANAVIDKKLGELLRKTLQKKLDGMMLSDCDELQSLKDSDKKKLWEEKKRKEKEKLRNDEEIKKWKEEYEKEKDKMLTRRALERIYEILQSEFGTQPTLSSSPQAPNTFTPQQNLFK